MEKSLINKKKNDLCAVPSCMNASNANILLYEFPAVKTIREKWKTFCGRNYSDYICKKKKICSVHFTPDCFHSTHSEILPKMLKEKAVPTILNANAQFPEAFKKETIPHIENLQKCRICLTTENDLINIFQEEENIIIKKVDKIIRCGQIVVCKDDGYPQNICPNCVTLLENAFKFKLLCEQSDQILRFESRAHRNKPLTAINNNVKDDVNDEKSSSSIETKLKEIDTNFGNEDDFNHSNYIVDNDQTEGDMLNENTRNNEYIEDEKTKVQKHSNNDKKTKNNIFEKEKKKRIRKKYKFIRNYQCDQCGIMTRGPTALEDHKRFQHLGILSYKCPECPKMFRRKVFMQIHLETVHVIEPVVCDICGKTKKNSKVLKNHRDLHFAEKKFKCDYCPYQASIKAMIRSHQTIHTEELNFACYICDKKFRTLGARLTHIKSVHEKIKPYKCDQCDKSFYCNSKLRKHSVVHTGLKPFVCPVCPSIAYSWYVALTAHQRSLHPNLKLETETTMYKQFSNLSRT